jgi:micrococcal nuclease
MLVVLVFAGLVLAQPVVVDGDTLRDGDERYRVENLDAPETGARAQCPAERALGRAAASELERWVAGARRVEAFPIGHRDRYGRVVARVEIDGADLGERLIALGLAKPWQGRKSDFCSAP